MTPSPPTKSIYESGEYLAQTKTWHEEDAPFKAKNILKMLKRHDIPLHSVADVGCGTGAVLDIVAQELPIDRAAGFDISPQVIEIASRRARPGLVFSQSNPFDSGETFDLAMALDVFEHVEDYLGFLKRMRVIGRRQLYHIPLDLSVQGLLRRSGILRARSQLGHLHYFTRDTAFETLAYTGHRVSDCFYTTLGYDQEMPALRRLATLPRRLALSVAPDVGATLLGGFSMMVLCE